MCDGSYSRFILISIYLGIVTAVIQGFLFTFFTLRFSREMEDLGYYFVPMATFKAIVYVPLFRIFAKKFVSDNGSVTRPWILAIFAVTTSLIPYYYYCELR